MSDWTRLGPALAEQEKFSSIFFDREMLDDASKQEMLKTFVLALHSDATGIVEAVNYKDHRRETHPVDTQTILYKSVDVYRYVLAILNLWGFSEAEFAAALEQKDDYLHYRHEMSLKAWSGQPVVLFDMDDVLAEFRTSFCTYVTSETGVYMDPLCPEYYNSATLKEHGLSGEDYFKSFVDKHGFRDLPRCEPYIALLTRLKEVGYWVQILTARPERSPIAVYDTYSWLRRNSIPADAVAFAPEKFSWLSQQRYFNKTKVFAIDDSAKHAAEYAKHGVTVLVPEKSYNREVAGLDRIVYVPKDEDPLQHVIKLL